ncbi:MAG TPA: AMP-binding protein [Xanthobacteraceae bacterium]|nr:AMP-binding protein [Xanthobacteraceae bacterium]
MPRQAVLSTRVPAYEERRREIEASPLPANIGALIDELAASVPDRVAWNFFDQGETITYAALRTEVNRLANGLRAIGVRKGSHVGVMLPNIAAFPLTWLALARLGAVMIPVNTRYTERELHYVLDDGEADFVVIDAGLLSVLENVPQPLPRLTDQNVVVVGDAPSRYRSWSAVKSAGSGDTPAGVDGVLLDDLLNIQYTSGTTGFPKGCMLTQRYWLVIGKVNAFRDGRTYRNILASTPFFYMDPQWQLMMTFFQRATLYVAERQSASRFMEWVRRYAIDFTLLPNVILKQPPSPHDRNNALIRVNIYGFSKADHAELEERYDLIAREAFGMTEIGNAIFMPIEETGMVGSGSCGLASPFRECRVADENGNPLPDGEIGELIVRGPGILQGYYRKPEANKASFHGDWFRTGDLFRRDERGFFYIVGRIKDMIRRAGENIAAREVEAVVCGLPEIAEAAAMPVPDATRGEEVKIYVVPQPGVTKADVSPQKIIDYCVGNLASFKVPRYIEYRDELPKTPSDKVAKHVLKAEKPDLRSGSWDRVEQRWH